MFTKLSPDHKLCNNFRSLATTFLMQSAVFRPRSVDDVVLAKAEVRVRQICQAGRSRTGMSLHFTRQPLRRPSSTFRVFERLPYSDNDSQSSPHHFSCFPIQCANHA